MNEDTNAVQQNDIKETNAPPVGTRIVIGTVGVLALVLVALIGLSYIKGQSSSQKSVMGTANEITPLVVSPTPQAVANVATVITPDAESTVAPTEASSPSCSRTGYAQKWEYLTAYTVKEDDTLQSI